MMKDGMRGHEAWVKYGREIGNQFDGVRARKREREREIMKARD